VLKDLHHLSNPWDTHQLLAQNSKSTSINEFSNPGLALFIDSFPKLLPCLSIDTRLVPLDTWPQQTQPEEDFISEFY